MICNYVLVHHYNLTMPNSAESIEPAIATPSKPVVLPANLDYFPAAEVEAVRVEFQRDALIAKAIEAGASDAWQID